MLDEIDKRHGRVDSSENEHDTNDRK
jgi:hypothetical protein